MLLLCVQIDFGKTTGSSLRKEFKRSDWAPVEWISSIGSFTTNTCKF